MKILIIISVKVAHPNGFFLIIVTLLKVKLAIQLPIIAHHALQKNIEYWIIFNAIVSMDTMRRDKTVLPVINHGRIFI